MSNQMAEIDRLCQLVAELEKENAELRDELKWLYAKLYSAHEDLRQAGVPVSSVTYIRQTEKGNLTRLRKEEGS